MPPLLPLGIERTVSVRSGASGSASGTFGGEWQCDSHCHSASSVLGSTPYTATRRRACWAAHRTLPLGGERTGRHVQGRVAVPPSLPLGIERTVSVRSGASGSASGTFRGEWQCNSHCHSVVNVPGSAPYTATRRRAYRIGTFRGEWQCWPGQTPDPQPSRRLESGPTGQMRSGNRPPSRRGSRRSPQASAWG